MSVEKCVYCNGASGDPKFSLEHIWPDALGGSYLPAHIFHTRQVCESCNNKCGQWVDGAFLKSWFLKAEGTHSAMQYLDPTKPEALPLFYIGIDTEFPVPAGEVCERWIGPSGAQIYHLHQEDHEKWTGYAGGDPIRRRRADPGRAYIVLTSTSQYWNHCALLSFSAHFKTAHKVSATYLAGDTLVPSIVNADHASVSDIERSEVSFITERKGFHKCNIPINLGFEDRFLCKVGLGLGSNVLGAEYSKSESANLLRQGLWTGSPEKRRDLELRGKAFFSDVDKRFTSLAGVPGAWVLILQAFQTGFGASFLSPEGRNFAILISDQRPSLPVLQAYREGAFFIVVPQRGQAFGPISGLEIVSHKLGHMIHPDLQLIESWRVSMDQLPPMTRE